MKLFILITGGRTGSSFFHSILDGHSEICSLPGEFFFDDFFDKVNKEKNYLKIARIFYKEYKYFFNSKLELIIFKDNLIKLNLVGLVLCFKYYLKRIFLFINFNFTKSKLVRKL